LALIAKEMTTHLASKQLSRINQINLGKNEAKKDRLIYWVFFYALAFQLQAPSCHPKHR
jgi:hypothetical protein